MNPISLIIADDHPIFREGLRTILEADDGCEVVHAAENGTEALEKAETMKPAVMILDVAMPEMGGLEVAEVRQRLNLPFELVLLTMHDDRETLGRAVELGVKGYVLKDDASDDIVRCVKTVLEGKVYVSSSVTHHLLPPQRGWQVKSNPALDGLTPSEYRILRLIARDLSSKEIAGELGISPKTVDNHRGNICTKLGLFGSHSLTRFSLENREALERGQ